MTRYINLFLIGFLCLWLNRSASTHDKLAVRNGINALFNEPKADNYVDVASLPVAYSVANTNVAGWFLVIDERQLDNLKVPADGRLVKFLKNWRDENLDNPNHLRWAKGDSWERVLSDNGLAIQTNGVPE
jgi:hypothetical protein